MSARAAERFVSQLNRWQPDWFTAINGETYVASNIFCRDALPSSANNDEESMMRWIEPEKKDWMPVFDEGIGKERVTIERGEYNYYRLRYWRGDTEALLHVRAETVDDMAGILINEGMFPEEEARAVAQKIIS